MQGIVAIGMGLGSVGSGGSRGMNGIIRYSTWNNTWDTGNGGGIASALDGHKSGAL